MSLWAFIAFTQMLAAFTSLATFFAASLTTDNILFKFFFTSSYVMHEEILKMIDIRKKMEKKED